MDRFRNTLLLVAVGAAALGGIYLLNQINSNNSINPSSANVYNVIGLTQVQDDVLYADKIALDINAQIIDTQTITAGNLELTYDKNLLEVDDIIMPSNIIAINQKVDSSAGTITLQISTSNTDGLKDVASLARIVFTKKQDSGRFTSVTLLSSSTLGNPNTLDPSDKSISISY